MIRGLFSLLACSLLVAATTARAATAFLPRGLTIYAQLDERVTSNTRKFRVGYEPLGHVWKDVEIDGVTIIEAGTPVMLRISRLSPRGIGGRGAQIQITAMEVEAIGDNTVRLSGGYGDETPDRYGLNRALSAVFWPTSFLPGRRAVLEEGTVFDMEVSADTYLEISDRLIPTVSLKEPSGLSVSLIYDELTEESKVLPLEVRLCDRDWNENVVVDSVNEEAIRPLVISTSRREYVGNCHVARSVVPLKELSDHFERGINRFTVTQGDLTEEVVINIEM
jgi:hypothetical protein